MPLVSTQMISISGFARCVVVSAKFVSRFPLNHSRSTLNKLTHVLICLPVHPYQLHMKSRSSRSRRNWTPFSVLSQGKKHFCLPHLAAFVGSLFGGIKRVKRVHSNGCPHLGKRDVHPCGCPVRLSFNTLDSFMGKLRAIFAAVGRQGELKSSLQLGNPASALEVKSYLKAFTAEQLQARVTVKQGVPLLLPKLHSLARFLRRKMNTPGICVQDLYILARNQAFLKTLFFSSDRGSDLRNVKTLEILRFPSVDGFLFSHIWGKIIWAFPSFRG